MAKAQLTTKLGTKVTIEGTSEEVGDLLARFDGEVHLPRPDRAAVHDATPRPVKKVSATLANLITELMETGFFSTPKELNTIKVALEERGHFYPVTTLSPALLRLVRKRELRRIKDNKRWMYVA